MCWVANPSRPKGYIGSIPIPTAKTGKVMNSCDIEEYSKFVGDLTSKPSKYLEALVDRLEELHTVQDCNVPGIMTGSTGLVCEAAELQEIVKKLIYQGKPLTKDIHTHMKKELGDVAFYFILMCRAIGTSPSEVIALNKEKLSARFANGSFSVKESEIRKEGDI